MACLDCRLVVVQGDWKWHRSMCRIHVPIRLPSITMAVSCTVSAITQDIGQNWSKISFFIPFLYNKPCRKMLQLFSHRFFHNGVRGLNVTWVNGFCKSALFTHNARALQTDRQKCIMFYAYTFILFLRINFQFWFLATWSSACACEVRRLSNKFGTISS